MSRRMEPAYLISERGDAVLHRIAWAVLGLFLGSLFVVSVYREVVGKW